MSAKVLSIETRIRQAWEQLSAHEQRLADIILASPGQIAMHTATELAASAGVSKATTTRFFRHLGYESYESARRQVRELQNSGAPLYLQQAADNLNPINDVIQTHLEREVANLVNTYRTLDAVELEAITKGIAQARRVVVLGWRHSQTIAALIRRDLVNVHEDVRLLPAAGDSLAESLADLGATDFAICVGLRRRMPVLDSAMSTLRVLQVPVLYLSDVLAGKPAQKADWVIRCHTETHMIFDSSASVSAVCNLLGSLVARERGKSGNERLAQIESLHQELDELE